MTALYIDSKSKKRIYKKLNFRGQIYEVGEVLFFRESEQSNLVGKLSKIIPEGGLPEHPKWPMIEVTWYYRK